MKRLVLGVIFCSVFTLLQAQSVAERRHIPDSLASLFYSQLNIFPQEKIYVHTDKPYYISGEKIWFRAYLVDAITHVPASASRYVYVELINPLDSVIVRVKIRPDEEAFYGHLLIPNDVPQGNYSLRAYTTFMRSQDEAYFFTKAIHIGEPHARNVHTETRFFFESAQRIHATFRFSDVHTSAPWIPHSATVSVNDGKPMNLRVESDGTSTINFDLPATSRPRALLLEVRTSAMLYRQFIQIPASDNDFDVGFYPEGGSLMLGTPCRVVFKALKSDGQPTDIIGRIYDQSGVMIEEIKSEHVGMGHFLLSAEQGKTYYAICENAQGQSKRFELPAAIGHGYALSIHQSRDVLYISALKPAGIHQHNELYLMAHTRGMVHLIEPWDHERNLVAIHKDVFPSGVLHVVLFDAGLNPVSERLFFINNQDRAQVAYRPDKEEYARRSLVKSTVVLTDPDGHPLAGSFSVSVTSDREVAPDSTSNILTQLLLTSDLRGHIENPAYYFRDTPQSAYALDLLMCTQGWRRYSMAELAQGRFSFPASPLEVGSEISGTVKNVLMGRPIEDVEVNVISFPAGYFNSVRTNREGRFYLPLGELPDSTRFMVSAEPRRGVTRMDLLLDAETFPLRRLSVVPPFAPDKSRFAQYAHRAEQQYTDEGGMRATLLSAAVVVAERKPPVKSVFYSEPVRSITEEDIERFPGLDVYDHLTRIPGVLVHRGEFGTSVLIRGTGTFFGDNSPLMVVDDIVVSNIDMVSINNIAQIDVLKGAEASIFGGRGSNGVIVIHTKKEITGRIASEPFHIKTLLPLGFQPPAEFYAPKYETAALRNSPKPDLRTTIHWQPVVQTNSLGEASFEFYTADEPGSYTVIIEGLCRDGQIIRQTGRVRR